MRTLYLLPLLLLSAVSTTAIAADAANGKALHEKFCISCHASRFGGDASQMYTRPNHRVSSYRGLIKQVTRCRDMLGITWFDEEVRDVAAYLNQTYYKFDSQ